MLKFQTQFLWRQKSVFSRQILQHRNCQGSLEPCSEQWERAEEGAVCGTNPHWCLEGAEILPVHPGDVFPLSHSHLWFISTWACKLLHKKPKQALSRQIRTISLFSHSVLFFASFGTQDFVVKSWFYIFILFGFFFHADTQNAVGVNWCGRQIQSRCNEAVLWNQRMHSLPPVRIWNVFIRLFKFASLFHELMSLQPRYNPLAVHRLEQGLNPHTTFQSIFLSWN